MSNYCAIKDSRVVEGQSLKDCIDQIANYVIELKSSFKLIINGREDSISYSKSDYSIEEVEELVTNRLKQILIYDGWNFYKSI